MRIFLAVELAGPLREGIGALQRRLAREGVSGIRWTDPGGIHLTLRFCGEVSAGTVQRLGDALDPGPPFSPFDLRIGGLGTFPPRGAPRVLFLSADGEDHLPSLAAWVEERVVSAGLAGEPRPFRPHLTLGRFRPGAPPVRRDLLAAPGAGDLGRQRVEQLVLFESHLGSGPARYEALRRFSLLGPGAP